jgi:PglZ domain
MAMTFMDMLASVLTRASEYNHNDQAPPVAVLWPDKERQWEPLLPLLRGRLPLLTLGPYAPAARTGPAYWVRCMLSRTLLSDVLPPDVVPIIYLPGVSRQDVRTIEDSPRFLQPLAELQYRSALWTHKNGRDWTIAGFLQAKDGGLGIEVVGDQATRQAMARALMKLANEPVETLRKEMPLRAVFFDALLTPDDIRSLLQWLNDPAAYQQRSTPAEWASFRGLCLRKYEIDPQTDGPVTAAQRLGERKGAWDSVWLRYAETARAYPQIPALLERARPAQLTMFETWASWPQDTQNAESKLREGLLELEGKLPGEARNAINALEAVHGDRRGWIWAGLGRAPLAMALQHLVRLARETERTPGGATIAEVAGAYAEWGWRADAALLDALAAVIHIKDVAAINAAAVALYRPWLEACALAFQKRIDGGAMNQTYPAQPLPPIEAGTCIVFIDALRFDVGQRLAEELKGLGLKPDIGWRLTALPSVTPTAKPAISPAAADMMAGDASKLEPVSRASGSRITAESLRKLIENRGFQILQGDELGDPAGKCWTEVGAIDAYGHEHGWKVAHHISAELIQIAQRVQALTEAGWRQVLIVTDHGWLMLPGGLPKAELPEHLTVIRKGRCARLKDGASTTQQTVPWFWDAQVRIAMAPGIHCFEAGKEYEHGGLSPQECVVPVLWVRPARARMQVDITNVIWRGLRCNLRVVGAAHGMLVDIRSKAGDGTSSIGKAPMPVADGTASLLVVDEDRTGTAAFIVVIDANGAISKQIMTTVGG